MTLAEFGRRAPRQRKTPVHQGHTGAQKFSVYLSGRHKEPLNVASRPISKAYSKSRSLPSLRREGTILMTTIEQSGPFPLQVLGLCQLGNPYLCYQIGF